MVVKKEKMKSQIEESCLFTAFLDKDFMSDETSKWALDYAIKLQKPLLLFYKEGEEKVAEQIKKLLESKEVENENIMLEKIYKDELKTEKYIDRITRIIEAESRKCNIEKSKKEKIKPK